MKLGAVCGIGWVAGPHEKGKETKSGSIARTTWQEPSRLNEANSLPLFLSLSLSSFPPPLLSRHSLPRSLLAYPLARSRTLAVLSSLGAAPHRPKSILGRRRERGDDACVKEKDVIQITDQPSFPLISSVCIGRAPSFSTVGGRGW